MHLSMCIKEGLKKENLKKNILENTRLTLLSHKYLVYLGSFCMYDSDFNRSHLALKQVKGLPQNPITY